MGFPGRKIAKNYFFQLFHPILVVLHQKNLRQNLGGFLAKESEVLNISRENFLLKSLQGSPLGYFFSELYRDELCKTHDFWGILAQKSLKMAYFWPKIG